MVSRNPHIAYNTEGNGGAWKLLPSIQISDILSRDQPHCQNLVHALMIITLTT